MSDPARRAPRPQRRARAIAMSAEELDAFLGAERTCRIATVGADGPHVTPLWFVWLEGCLWIYSLTNSQRWADLEVDPRVAAVVDDGHAYLELRGVELRGSVEVVGEVPRTGIEDVAGLAAVESAFSRKYRGVEEFDHDGKHAWLRLEPEKIYSWDFRKITT